MTYRIAILGASGYTGAELVRLVATHPGLEISALTADRKAGQEMAEVFPHLRHMPLPRLTRIDDADFSEADIVFCALPHGMSQEVVRDLPGHPKVIDLSAGFRLRDTAKYATWYGTAHAAPQLQAAAVYGLTEFYRDDIVRARLVAGTGCNVATGLYALLPPLMAEAIDPDDILLDLKCGVSGAGRAVKEHLLHAELSEGVMAYGLGGTHRHLGEFDQELSRAVGRDVRIQFTPTLLPVNRGILAACYVRGDAKAIHAVLCERYADEPFLTVLPFGQAPATHHVRGSNFVHLGVVEERREGRATIYAALDNLTKGSSGQAIQNANLMLGLPETEGLVLAPVFP
jgi:N-acetyl-gamma-glutamyl-phosphate reductase